MVKEDNQTREEIAEDQRQETERQELTDQLMMDPRRLAYTVTVLQDHIQWLANVLEVQAGEILQLQTFMNGLINNGELQ